MLITPSVTPLNGNNPGVSILTLDEKTLKPLNLESHFFQLHKYILNPEIDEWFKIDYQKDFGFQDLTAKGINDWMQEHKGEKEATLDFLIKKIGYLPEEKKYALDTFYVDDMQYV